VFVQGLLNHLFELIVEVADEPLDVFSVLEIEELNVHQNLAELLLIHRSLHRHLVHVVLINITHHHISRTYWGIRDFLASPVYHLSHPLQIFLELATHLNLLGRGRTTFSTRFCIFHFDVHNRS
jgi:hypothetical protein